MTRRVLRKLLSLPVVLAICAPLSLAQTGTTTRVEQNDPTVTYSGTWYSNDSSETSGGRSALTNDKGAQVAITFTGTGITWIGVADPYSGIAWLYLDGTLHTIDTYSDTTHYQQPLFSVRGLAPGPHTLSIEVPHIRGPNTDGSWVWVDAFDIENGSGIVGGTSASAGRIEENNAALSYTGSWFPNTSNVNSGGSAVLASNVGSGVTISFTGTSIVWITYRDEWSGIARIFVDGALKATVDTYATPPVAQAAAYSINGLVAGTHSLTIEVAGTHNASSGGSWIWMDAFQVVGTTGATGLGAVNAASYVSSVAAGSIASVFGSNLSFGTATAGTLPLPTTLASSSLQIGGRSVPLFFASPGQLNVQIAWELAGQTLASATVTVGGVGSNQQTVSIAPYAPGIFTLNNMGTGQGVALIGGTALFAAPLSVPGGRPARPGEFVSIFCTGLGAVSNQPATGTAAAPAGPSSVTIATPTVTIGGTVVPTSFSGLAPGFVGLYQVNVQVPVSAIPGDAVPIVLSIGGVASNTVTIAVQ